MLCSVHARRPLQRRWQHMRLERLLCLQRSMFTCKRAALCNGGCSPCGYSACFVCCASARTPPWAPCSRRLRPWRSRPCGLRRACSHGSDRVGVAWPPLMRGPHRSEPGSISPSFPRAPPRFRPVEEVASVSSGLVGWLHLTPPLPCSGLDDGPYSPRVQST